MKQARTQSALMAEQYLSNLNGKEGCFHQSFCEAAHGHDARTARAAQEAIR